MTNPEIVPRLEAICGYLYICLFYCRSTEVSPPGKKEKSWAIQALELPLLKKNVNDTSNQRSFDL